MSLTRQIAHNTSTQIIGKVISTVLGVVAVMIMTRSLGVEQYGWYATAAGFLQFIGILSDFGFTVTTANMLSEPAFDKKKLLNNLFSWRVLSATIIQLVTPLLILLFPYPTPIKLAVIITSVSFFAFQINQVFVGYYQAHLQTKNIIFGEIVGRIILVGGMALTAFYHTGFISFMIIITIAALANLLYVSRRVSGLRFQFDKEISQSIFKKVWPNALALIFNAFYLQGDRFLLPLFVPQTEVGLYSAAYRVLDIASQIAAIIMGIMMPLATYAWSRKMLPEFKQRFQTSLNLMALVLLPLIAGIYVLAEPIMNFIAGNDFLAAGEILRWLNWAIVGVCFGMVFGHLMLALNHQRQALWIYASDAILSVIGYLYFIPQYGIWGAAGVTIFSEAYAGILLTLSVIYYSKTRPDLKTFTKIIFSSIAMGAVVYFIQPLNLLLSVLVGILTYGILVLLFRIITKKTLQEIFKRPTATQNFDGLS